MRVRRGTTKVVIIKLDEEVKFPVIKLVLDFTFGFVVLGFGHAAGVLVQNLKFSKGTLKVANVLELVCPSFVLGQSFLDSVRVRECLGKGVKRDLIF